MQPPDGYPNKSGYDPAGQYAGQPYPAAPGSSTAPQNAYNAQPYPAMPVSTSAQAAQGYYQPVQAGIPLYPGTEQPNQGYAPPPQGYPTQQGYPAQQYAYQPGSPANHVSGSMPYQPANGAPTYVTATPVVMAQPMQPMVIMSAQGIPGQCAACGSPIRIRKELNATGWCWVILLLLLFWPLFWLPCVCDGPCNDYYAECSNGHVTSYRFG